MLLTVLLKVIVLSVYFSLLLCDANLSCQDFHPCCNSQPINYAGIMSDAFRY